MNFLPLKADRQPPPMAGAILMFLRPAFGQSAGLTAFKKQPERHIPHPPEIDNAYLP